jgi:rod shape-determining protein MreC
VPVRTSRGVRGVRSDGRVDAILIAVALLIGIIARAIPESRADHIAGSLRSSVFAPLAALQRKAERARGALVAHDSLTLIRDSVVMRAFDATRLSSENEELRRLIGLSGRVRTGFVAAEAMHGPEPGEEFTLVLNAGASAGIRAYSAVIAPDGIVGMVRSAEPTSSVAIVWPHPDFRVSAMAANGAGVGIASAHLGSGASRFLLELRGVPFRNPLDSGTLIVSSGIGGTFPKGIPVGTVLSQLPSTEGWERNYLLLPAVHPADIYSVLVLLPERAAVDLRSVWYNPDSVANATKRMLTASDTAARAAAARRDSAAKAALPKSVPPDTGRRER